MAYLKIYGTNGSQAGPEGSNKPKLGTNTICYGIFNNKEVVFLDAVSGLIKASKELLELEPEKITIVLSHFHHDHIDGFLLAQMSYHTPYGTKPNIYGPPFIKEALKKRFAPLVSPCSIKSLINIESFNEIEENQELIIGDIFLRTFTGGYHPPSLDRKLKKDQRSRLLNNHGVLGWIVEVEGHRIAYATDMEFDYKKINDKVVPISKTERQRRINNYITAVYGSKILIADGQYTEDEYTTQGKYHGFGHSYPEQVIGLALEAKVGKIIISHHMPTRTDKEIDDLETKLRRKFSQIEINFAREGDIIQI